MFDQWCKNIEQIVMGGEQVSLEFLNYKLDRYFFVATNWLVNDKFIDEATKLSQIQQMVLDKEAVQDYIKNAFEVKDGKVTPKIPF